jgi:hypothetical protein
MKFYERRWSNYSVKPSVSQLFRFQIPFVPNKEYAMQTFHDRLFHARGASALLALTRLSRAQVLEATRSLTWMLWGPS